MEKVCKKWLKLLPFTECTPPADERSDMSHTLKLQLEKMNYHRREPWRERPLKLENHPLAIKRSTDQKKRATFWDVFRLRHEDHNSVTKTVQDIWRMRQEEMTKTGSHGTKDEIIDIRLHTDEIPVDKATVSDHLRDCEDACRHCYENINFINEEMEKERDHFVTSFGKKGKQIGEFEDAKDLVCLPDGGLIVADMVIGRLQKFYNNASSVTLLGPEDVTYPLSVTLTNENNVAVSLCTEHCVRVLSKDGERLLSFGEETLQSPAGIACDKEGRFIVCDSKAGSVSLFDKTGRFLRYLGNPDKKEQCFLNPRYVCLSINGDIIVADSGHHKVKIFNKNGDFVKSFGTFGKDDGHFKCPYGVCTDKFGSIYVADHYNSRISMFTRDGIFLRHIVKSDHGLLHPQGIKIDSNLYMYVTHGHLKATEVVIFKLSNAFSYKGFDTTWHERISYV